MVGVSPLMNRHQGFLHKVLDIAELGLHPFFQKAPHRAAHEAECAWVTGVIALQGLHPCGVQFGFECVQAFVQVSSSSDEKSYRYKTLQMGLFIRNFLIFKFGLKP